jgi:hypothetical protein
MTFIEECVIGLDAYKRRVGRKFDRATCRDDVIWYFNKYNEIEDVITRMLEGSDIKRKAKPNKLTVDALERRLAKCSN